MCLSSEASGHNPFVDYPSQQLDVILPEDEQRNITSNIQVGSFQQTKSVRHFHVPVWVCLQMKEQANPM